MTSKSVFISHNWSDKVFARKLANDLMIRGVQVWIDEGEIKLGDSLIQRIREGIDQMEYLAVVLSPDSVASEWVRREVDIAMNQEIDGKRVKVLPLLYRRCELPGFLKGKLYADFTAEGKYQMALGLLLQRLDITANGGTLFIFKKDIQGIFRFVNMSFAKAFAKRTTDIIGKTDKDLFPEELAKSYMKSDKTVMKTGEASAHFEVHKGPEGKDVVVQVIKHPTFDDEGNIDGVEGIYWTPRTDYDQSIAENKTPRITNGLNS